MVKSLFSKRRRERDPKIFFYSVVFVVLTLCLPGVNGCDWPLVQIADAATPDTIVEVVDKLPNETQENNASILIQGKIALFGACPPDDVTAIFNRVLFLSDAEGSNSKLCNSIEDVGGAIVVAQRGECNFFNKTINAWRANASALIVGNDESDLENALFPMGCPQEYDSLCNNMSIPSIMISSKDYQALKLIIAAHDARTLRMKVYARKHPSIDPASVIIWAMGVSIVVIASYLSAYTERNTAAGNVVGERGEVEGFDKNLPFQELNMGHALGFIVVSSGVLVFLFFFIRDLILILVVLYCFASISAFVSVATPLLERAFQSCAKKVHLWRLGRTSVSILVTLPLCIAIAVFWFVNRHQSSWVWILQDIMSASLCLHIISIVRFNDIKVCTVLLSLAVLYDIFWVFISPLLFSENVMIGVATGQGHDWTNGTDHDSPPEMIPMLLVVPKVLDWAGGVTLLGLGDVVLPGLLVSFALRVDNLKQKSALGGYFLYISFGYAVGLMFAILVPCTLWPFLLLSWSRGELKEMWEGPFQREESDHHDASAAEENDCLDKDDLEQVCTRGCESSLSLRKLFLSTRMRVERILMIQRGQHKHKDLSAANVCWTELITFFSCPLFATVRIIPHLRVFPLAHAMSYSAIRFH
mmetsp:Transcript_18565/g.60958  ORF Transcript_18565/g.60958 Transcript_18565/m.60958 type:complete len:643 (-) Transcript_18565:177-2105(-)